MEIEGKIESFASARRVCGITLLEAYLAGVKLMFFSINVDFYKLQKIYTEKELVKFKGIYYQEDKKEYLIVKEILPYI